MDLDEPAYPPPDGITPNFDNPTNRNAFALGILVACVTVTTICFLMRVYARVYLLKKIRIEEILAVLAYGCYWGPGYTAFAMVRKPGYFVHQWDVRCRDFILTNYYVFVFGVCYSFVLPLLKIAILVEWCRLLAPQGLRSRTAFWWGCMVTICIQVIAGIGIILALNLQCIPHRAIYDLTVPGKCVDLYKIQLASASVHLTCDAIMLLLPQPVIWTLKMTWRKRLGVSFVFSLGVLACASAALRLDTTVIHANADDPLYSLAPLVLCSMAEMTCGFFIFCLPCIPKIIKETGVIRRIKSVLGVKTTPTKPSGYSENYGTRVSAYGSASYMMSNNIRRDKQKGTESMEYLHEGILEAGGIIRTTHISVTEESRTASDDESKKAACPYISRTDGVE
ncbi:hypothetical protein BDV32DRAFT_134950 [Aspergillus pseudonomiae]|uniref:Rhodopsin domain-containing protein n=1 Tax=Aspergillus pseudonomiae TaxID=1506151 RepID=A0A5N7D954_9EURO|nr:uncharacterized protein BDV37DRAFT_284928 [Aspergillus pseudonomiae]KAB8265105.1 hypothetical protein BDV32DRAFT_134950 [Aspergillus pseudonomiae]KAE8402278.1 hypothetical protein BDV37DRAFT_284928 [Aspergillus pseudonomiae]